jgi:GNAT superfamily N-acetyltransferase
MTTENLTEFEIKVFDKESVSDSLINQYFDLINAGWKELHPLEPLPLHENLMQHFFEPIPNKQSFSWLTFKKNEIVGSCDLLIESTDSPFFEERKNTGQFWLGVTKKYRRRGLGSEMLRTIVDKVSEFEYVDSIMLTGATPLKESIAFCDKFGGEVTYESEENRIYLEDINWGIIQKMKDEGYQDFSGFSIEVFEKISDTFIEEYAKSFSEIRLEKPFTEIPVEKRVTPKKLRNFETELSDDKIRWIHFVMRDDKNEIIALGDLRYHLDALERVNEAYAGVRFGFQETKIKEVLKSEMLLHVKENFPKVRKIYIWFEHPTMEDLNKKLGFTKHYQGKHFKFNLKELKKLL